MEKKIGDFININNKSLMIIVLIKKIDEIRDALSKEEMSDIEITFKYKTIKNINKNDIKQLILFLNQNQMNTEFDARIMYNQCYIFLNPTCPIKSDFSFGSTYEVKNGKWEFEVYKYKFEKNFYDFFCLKAIINYLKHGYYPLTPR